MEYQIWNYIIDLVQSHVPSLVNEIIRTYGRYMLYKFFISQLKKHQLNLRPVKKKAFKFFTTDQSNSQWEDEMQVWNSYQKYFSIKISWSISQSVSRSATLESEPRMRDKIIFQTNTKAPKAWALSCVIHDELIW